VNTESGSTTIYLGHFNVMMLAVRCMIFSVNLLVSPRDIFAPASQALSYKKPFQPSIMTMEARSLEGLPVATLFMEARL
jgi:hypothetical protein